MKTEKQHSSNPALSFLELALGLHFENWSFFFLAVYWICMSIGGLHSARLSGSIELVLHESAVRSAR